MELCPGVDEKVGLVVNLSTILSLAVETVDEVLDVVDNSEYDFYEITIISESKSSPMWVVGAMRNLKSS